MPKVKLCYIYRDYANYKNYNDVIFANPDNLSLEEIAANLQSKLMDGMWFFVSRWGLKDIHFDNYDDEDDHPYHEFQCVEYTEDKPSEANSISEFMKNIRKTDYLGKDI